MLDSKSENQVIDVVNSKLKALQDLYQGALRDCLGAFSKVNENENIGFKYGGLGYVWISTDADDLGYFRLFELVKVGRWSDENEIKVLKAVNNVAVIKCAKLSIRQVEGDIILVNAVEAFLAGSEQIPTREIIETTLERYANILSVARSYFGDELEKLGGLS